MADKKLEKLISELRGKDKIKVLFVCLGNICRSPAADGIMRALVDERGDAGRWVIDSAGTGGWHVGDLPDKRMRVHGARRGLRFDHICRQVKEGDFDDFDMIIGMDSGNLRDLHRLAPTPEAEDKIVAMADFFNPGAVYDHVPDPYYDGAQGFETVLDLLQDATLNLYERLTPST
ncbi:MAG: low molecular weight phosphotyrosine protein phosphatase [Barnesiella sp.]|nr:low molecular weight phosphotyrosine protein phosphatase [Barnesiella sp.]